MLFAMGVLWCLRHRAPHRGGRRAVAGAPGAEDVGSLSWSSFRAAGEHILKHVFLSRRIATKMKSASIAPGCSEKKEFELARGLRVGFARAKRARARFWGFWFSFMVVLRTPFLRDGLWSFIAALQSAQSRRA